MPAIVLFAGCASRKHIGVPGPAQDGRFEIGASADGPQRPIERQRSSQPQDGRRWG